MVAPWVETTDVVLGPVSRLYALAERDGAYVVSGEPAVDDSAAQLWCSGDGRVWQLAAMPAEAYIDRIHTISSTTSGFAALGLDFSGDDTITRRVDDVPFASR